MLCIGSLNFRLMAMSVIQFGSRFCLLLRHMPMRGYDVCGERRLGMRCRCSLLLFVASVYIWFVTMFPVHFFSRLRALCGEILCSNAVICSSTAMESEQQRGAMCGSSP